MVHGRRIRLCLRAPHRRPASCSPSRSSSALRERSLWRGLRLIAHAWGVILGAIALVAWWPNPLTVTAGGGLIGSRQLGSPSLCHDGAHGCFSTNQRLNMGLSQWLCAYPDLRGDRAYRRYHLQHHRRTQQEDDPDLVLSAPFPDHQGQLPAKVLARHHGADRLRAAQGAAAHRARRSELAAAAARRALLEQARAAGRWSTRCCSRRWRRPACGGPIRCCGCCRC